MHPKTSPWLQVPILLRRWRQIKRSIFIGSNILPKLEIWDYWFAAFGRPHTWKIRKKGRKKMRNEKKKKAKWFHVISISLTLTRNSISKRERCGSYDVSKISVGVSPWKINIRRRVIWKIGMAPICYTLLHKLIHNDTDRSRTDYLRETM